MNLVQIEQHHPGPQSWGPHGRFNRAAQTHCLLLQLSFSSHSDTGQTLDKHDKQKTRLDRLDRLTADKHMLCAAL